VKNYRNLEITSPEGGDELSKARSFDQIDPREGSKAAHKHRTGKRIPKLKTSGTITSLSGRKMFDGGREESAGRKTWQKGQRRTASFSSEGKTRCGRRPETERADTRGGSGNSIERKRKPHSPGKHEEQKKRKQKRIQ